MKTELYTHYDKVACQAEGILHARNEADAIRTFIKRFKERDDSLDFSLLHLGNMDHDEAKIYLLDIPNDIPVAMPQDFGTGEKPNGNIQ